MRNTLLASFLTLIVILPTIAIAADGVVTMYGPWFNDSASLSGTPFRHLHYIGLANPDDNDAVFEISYYDKDGHIFANTSSFTHTVPAKGNYVFRPNSDLQLNDSNEITGSYVIKVTTGSLIGSSSHIIKAGTSLPDIGTEYDVNDNLPGYSLPLEPSSANYLNLHYFWQYDENGDTTVALNPGDYDSVLYINNPDDTRTAEVNLYFYKPDGTPHDCNLDGSELIPVTYTIDPHETIVKRLGDSNLEMNGISVDQGPITMDLTKGSVIAYCELSRCQQGKNVKTYELYAYPFMEKHMH